MQAECDVKVFELNGTLGLFDNVAWFTGPGDRTNENFSSGKHYGDDINSWYCPKFQSQTSITFTVSSVNILDQGPQI